MIKFLLWCILYTQAPVVYPDLKQIATQLNALKKQIDVINEQVISLPNHPSIQPVEQSSKEQILENLRTTIHQSYFKDIREYCHGIAKTITVLKQQSQIRNVLYKNAFLAAIVVICSLLAGYISCLLIRSIQSFTKELIFYLTSIIYIYCFVPLTVDHTILIQLIRLPIILGLGLGLSKSWLQKTKRQRSMSVNQRIVQIIVKFLGRLCLMLTLVQIGYYIARFNGSNPILGTKQISLVIFGCLFTIFIQSNKRVINYALMQSGLIRRSRYAVAASAVSIWPWIVIISSWLIVYTALSYVKQTRLLFKAFVTISSFLLLLIGSRILRFALIKFVRQYKRNDWYRLGKRYILLCVGLIFAEICNKLWAIKISRGIVSVITENWYQTLLSAGKLIILFHVSRFSIDYISYSYQKTTRDSVRRLFTGAAHTIAICVTFMAFLNVLGLNLTWVGAGLSFFSAGLAFGVRDTLNDMMSGFLLVIDNSFSLGDVLVIADTTGVVEELSLVTLKLRLDNGMLVSYRYGSIQQLGSKSKNYSYALITIPIQGDIDPDIVINAIKYVFDKVKQSPTLGDKILGPLEIKGIDQVQPEGLVVQARVKTMYKAEALISKTLDFHTKTYLTELTSSER